VSGNPNIILAKVDHTKNEIEGIPIDGTPSWRFLQNGKKDKAIPLYGTKSANSILQSIKSFTTHPWIQNEDL